MNDLNYRETENIFIKNKTSEDIKNLPIINGVQIHKKIELTPKFIYEELKKIESVGINSDEDVLTINEIIAICLEYFKNEVNKC